MDDEPLEEECSSEDEYQPSQKDDTDGDEDGGISPGKYKEYLKSLYTFSRN